MKTLQRLAIVAAAFLLVLAAVLAFNTLRLEAEPLAKALPAAPVDAAAVKRLSEAAAIGYSAASQR